jgi:CDP-diglyceride synthetase
MTESDIDNVSAFVALAVTTMLIAAVFLRLSNIFSIVKALYSGLSLSLLSLFSLSMAPRSIPSVRFDIEQQGFYTIWYALILTWACLQTIVYLIAVLLSYFSRPR